MEIDDPMLFYSMSQPLINLVEPGFLLGRSIISQSISSVNPWITALRQKIQSDFAYVDYANVFDILRHRKLLYKLKAYCFKLNLLKWVDCSFPNRLFEVKSGKYLSPSLEIVSGITHGSALRAHLIFLRLNNVPGNSLD